MKYLLFVLVVGLFACNGDPITEEQKGDFKLQLLFEKDGCKMYRFQDGSRNIYWADCAGKVNSDFTTQSGKTTIINRVEAITTE